MGNTESSSSSSSPSTGILRRNGDNTLEVVSLAMMAVARNIFLKKVHILILRYAMAKLSDDFGMIQREGFERALAKANLSNVEIFDLLFTMWDNADDGKVFYKEFCMGIAPLACPFDDLSLILEFSLRVSDDLDRKYIEKKELHELLTGINSTALYFGDIHLLPVDIDGIVEAVFEQNEGTTHEECVRRLSMNPYIKRFASGKVRRNIRFKDILVTNYIFDKEMLVTEYIVDDTDTLITSACDDEKDNIFENGESSRDDNNDAPATEAHLLFMKDFVNAPLIDEIDSCENSGKYGNAIITKYCRDPPPSIGRRGNRTYTELSYSTYQRRMSPSISRDPPTIYISSMVR